MKEPEYTEGPEALENFKRGMEAVFKVPKTAVLRPKKEPKKKPTSGKPRHSSLRVTPAMEAGVTDHIWTITELLSIV